MDNTLVYNSDNLRNLAHELNSCLGTFEGNIAEMFGVIDGTLNSPEYWQGQAYDQFKLYCDEYRATKIEDLIAQLKEWISDLERAADNADETTARNVGMFG